MQTSPLLAKPVSKLGFLLGFVYFRDAFEYLEIPIAPIPSAIACIKYGNIYNTEYNEPKAVLQIPPLS